MTAREAARVRVDLPAAPYDVVVADGALDDLATLVPWPPGARTAALVTCEPVARHYAQPARRALAAAGLDVAEVVVPDGEHTKTMATLEALLRRLAGIPLERSDVVVALGGGVVGDLAGFAAATYARGVPLVQVPTTLLAMVDAAVGGKTGVNLPEGKNLVGAFHQPVAVVADPLTLGTLPAREHRAGLGEVAKYGFIADPAVLDALEADPGGALRGDGALLGDLIVRSLTVKAGLVASDERDTGRRMLLNYGHTVGHAVETLTSYERYRHGEAVGLGMLFAARLGEALGVSAGGLARRTAALLDALGLPTGGLELDPGQVWDVLARDKKSRGGVRFVLCREPGDVVVVEEPDRAAVDAALRSLR